MWPGALLTSASSHLIEWLLQLSLGSTKLRLEISRLQHDGNKVKVMVSVAMGAMTNLSHLQTQTPQWYRRDAS